MITNYQILGERNSGTNYLEQLLHLNFKINRSNNFISKHFFGFDGYSGIKDEILNNTLFIAIVRDPFTWINSMYKNPYHLPESLKATQQGFLNNEWYSIFDDETEILHDRNIYNTEKRYKNLFELRKIKLKFLVEEMPKLVKNYILIRYEDLLFNLKPTMTQLLKFNIIKKNNNKFPINILHHTKDSKRRFIYKYELNFLKYEIDSHPDFDKYYEKQLKYTL